MLVVMGSLYWRDIPDDSLVELQYTQSYKNMTDFHLVADIRCKGHMD